jgi:hypothetical protein
VQHVLREENFTAFSLVVGGLYYLPLSDSRSPDHVYEPDESSRVYMLAFAFYNVAALTILNISNMLQFKMQE